jgi:hypothetical protein
MKRGVATFHHPLLMHGSCENTSTAQRRATVLNVIRDGVRSNMNSRDMGNFPRVPQGQVMEGLGYPLLFDPRRELGSAVGDVPLLAPASSRGLAAR